jgi:hypothetical protein
MKKPFSPKSEADVRQWHEKQQQEQRDRAQRWRENHQRFLRRVTISGGIFFALSSWIASYGGTMHWFMWILCLFSGALFAHIIARFTFGILLGSIIYGLGCFTVWLFGYTMGHWLMKSDIVGHVTMFAGSFILMIMNWLSCIIAGAVIGYLSAQYDEDHLHM